MNLAGNPIPLNKQMRAAYKAVGIPLWVTPQEVVDSLRREHWSEQISLELGEWFARVWSMAFAAGYRGIKPFAPPREHVVRVLKKMDYAPARVLELTGMLLDNIDGLYRKGCERRDVKP